MLGRAKPCLTNAPSNLRDQDDAAPSSRTGKTQLWLNQFDKRPGDRELAEVLLDSINYCPLNEFKNSLTKLIKKRAANEEVFGSVH